jgi:2-oxoglutarate dehydrogenase E2 component (dihydrolipoamide succinyltransferase)
LGTTPVPSLVAGDLSTKPEAAVEPQASPLAAEEAPAEEAPAAEAIADEEAATTDGATIEADAKEELTVGGVLGDGVDGGPVLLEVGDGAAPQDDIESRVVPSEATVGIPDSGVPAPLDPTPAVQAPAPSPNELAEAVVLEPEISGTATQGAAASEPAPEPAPLLAPEPAPVAPAPPAPVAPEPAPIAPAAPAAEPVAPVEPATSGTGEPTGGTPAVP